MGFQSDSTGVPAVDASANVTFRDVIGNKTDTHAGTSIISGINRLEDHIHGIAKVIPSMADGVLVAAPNTDWTGLGDFVVVAATNAISSLFDIHYVSVEDISANGVYELVLYQGANASEVECARVRFVQNAVQDATVNVPIMTPLIAANTQIKAKLASDNAVADTVRFSLGYHTYE